jgi:hypothetical protein
LFLTLDFQVCLPETHSQPFLTGIGFIDRNNVIADVNANVPFTDPAALLTTYTFGTNDNQIHPNRRIFAFHQTCWTILLTRITPTVPGQAVAPDEIASLAANLYHILFSLAGDRGRFLNPAHDYGGAWLPHPNFGVIYAVPEDDLWPVDPSLLSEDPGKASICSNPPQKWLTNYGQIQGFNSPGDFFTRLPGETRMAIITRLGSIDLCSLRLASRAMASISSPTHLPLSFWYSRFGPSFEMGFYMGGSLPAPSSRDWRALYGQIRSCLTKPHKSFKYGALWNRRRIWNVLGSLSITLESLLEGLPAKQASQNYAALLSFKRGMAAAIHRISDENPAGPTTTFTFSWNVEDTFAQNQIKFIYPIEISTSFIHFDGHAYVCGIRATTSSPNITISQVGLTRPTTQQSVYLENGQEITKVRVLCSAMGAVGLSLFIQPVGSENTSLGLWHSFGITGKSNIPLGTAELESSTRILGLALEFDVCPILSSFITITRLFN